MRTVPRVRTSERQSFSTREPCCAPPSPPLPPTSTRYEMRAHAFYELVKLRFLYLRGTERRRSNDTRPIEKLPRDLTSAQLERKRTSCADDLCSSFFPPFHTLPFRGKRKGQRRAVTSRLLFRKIYNRPFTTSVKIYTGPENSVTR